MLNKKPKRYHTKTGERCDNYRVQFLINKGHITFAIYENMDSEGNFIDNWKPTQKNIEKEIRRGLVDKGYQWAEAAIDYEEVDLHRWVKAGDIGRKVFPFWYINKKDNAINFIMEA